MVIFKGFSLNVLFVWIELCVQFEIPGDIFYEHLGEHTIMN